MAYGKADGMLSSETNGECQPAGCKTRNWPWVPSQNYFLTAHNASSARETFILNFNGRDATNDDNDSDGLLDAWEGLHVDNTGYRGTSDPDKDGIDNATEFADGTDPNDANSANYTLTVTAIGGTITRVPDRAKYDKGTIVNLAFTPDNGLSFVGWSGAVQDTRTSIQVTVDQNLILTGRGGLPLREALDLPGAIWTTGGDGLWLGQSTTSHDGVDAAESGAIGHNQESWLETAVAGPGALTFWWKVSSEDGFDHLEFLVDGNLEQQISGGVDWTLVSFNVPSGSHSLRWRYVKDRGTSEGQDQGWLDQVVFGASAASPEHRLQTQWIGGGVLRLVISIDDPSGIEQSRLANLEVFAANDLATPVANWTKLTEPLNWVEGGAVMEVSDLRNFPQRFYLVIESP